MTILMRVSSILQSPHRRNTSLVGSGFGGSGIVGRVRPAGRYCIGAFFTGNGVGLGTGKTHEGT
jgi:hypothetical protein